MANNGESTQKPAAGQQAEPMERSVSGIKRKEMERKKPSFKVIGHLVMAMRRFSESINPTYTYGKRNNSSSGGASKLVTEDSEVVTSGEKRLERPPSASRRQTSPRPTSPDGHDPPKYAYSTRGHKFDFLLKPLPPTEDEEIASVSLGR